MAGIDNITVVTLDNITKIANGTTPVDFLVRANEIIYNGVYWFVMLWIFWIIIYVAANKIKDQPLNNGYYIQELILGSPAEPKNPSSKTPVYYLS